MFKNCTGLQKVTLRAGPHGQKIAPFSFYECSNLSQVVLTDFSARFMSIHVGMHAFQKCKNLCKIVDASGNDAFSRIKTFGESCFKDCTSLSSLRIRGAHIQRNAFYECTGIETLYLDNPSSMDSGCFEKCYRLKTVHLSTSLDLHFPFFVFNYCAIEAIYLQGNVSFDENSLNGVKTLQRIVSTCGKVKLHPFSISNLAEVIDPYKLDLELVGSGISMDHTVLEVCDTVRFVPTLKVLPKIMENPLPNMWSAS